jgi:arylsulfatase
MKLTAAAGFKTLLCALALAAPARAAGAPAGQAPDIILIVVDCLRADHLSLYGYGRPTSPKLDAFAREAVVFRRASAPAPTTLLSFASIFTSREVSSHGVNALDRALGDSALTLAGILKIYNYRTAAFVGGLNLNPLFKLDQGFDDYVHINRTDASFKDTLPAALAWAKERAARGEKFFLVAHGNDLHTPYVFPASGLYDKGFKTSPRLGSLSESDERVFAVYKRRLKLAATGEVLTLTDGDAGHLVARYDEGINYSDALVGDFLEKLRAGKLLDNAVVIITADHGEGLFDHDYFFHDFNLYEDTLRVPLLVRAPGLAAGEVTEQVALIDLLPTVLDLAGIAPPEGAQGLSLRPLLYGREPGAAFSRDIFSESGVGGKAVRSGKWKLIWAPGRAELYDLESDPGEKKDLAAKEKKTVAGLKARILARLAADRKDQLGEALRSPDGFAAEMARDDAWLKSAYKEMNEAAGGR